MRYRVYLLNERNKIKAAETFIAADDAEALEMGAVLFRAISDSASSYELWCGSRKLTRWPSRSTDGGIELADQPEDRQFRMLDLEERLLTSFACIRESRALLATTTELIEARDRRAEAAPIKAPLPGP